MTIHPAAHSTQGGVWFCKNNKWLFRSLVLCGLQGKKVVCKQCGRCQLSKRCFLKRCGWNPVTFNAVSEYERNLSKLEDKICLAYLNSFDLIMLLEVKCSNAFSVAGFRLWRSRNVECEVGSLFWWRYTNGLEFLMFNRCMTIVSVVWTKCSSDRGVVSLCPGRHFPFILWEAHRPCMWRHDCVGEMRSAHGWTLPCMKRFQCVSVV